MITSVLLAKVDPLNLDRRGFVLRKLEWAKKRKQIKEMLDSGNYTLQAVANKFHCTRENIRSLYKKITNSPSTARKTKMALARLSKRKEEKNQVKLICESCLQPVKRIESPRSTRFCPRCRIKWEKYDFDVVLQCGSCGRDFHPHKVFKYQTRKTNNGYCSRFCYFNKRFPTKRLVSHWFYFWEVLQLDYG